MEGRIPNEFATHSINIIYQNLNHNETLNDLKLSLNARKTTKVESQSSLPHIPLTLFIKI